MLAEGRSLVELDMAIVGIMGNLEEVATCIVVTDMAVSIIAMAVVEELSYMLFGQLYGRGRDENREMMIGRSLFYCDLHR